MRLWFSHISLQYRLSTSADDNSRCSIYNYFFSLTSSLTENTACLNHKDQRLWHIISPCKVIFVSFSPKSKTWNLINISTAWNRSVPCGRSHRWTWLMWWLFIVIVLWRRLKRKKKDRTRLPDSAWTGATSCLPQLVIDHLWVLQELNSFHMHVKHRTAVAFCVISVNS